MRKKTFLQPSVSGFAARIKQQPEDFRVTELPLAAAVHAAVPADAAETYGHRKRQGPVLGSAEPPKRQKNGSEANAIQVTAQTCGLAATHIPALSGFNEGPRGEHHSGLDLHTLPLPDEALLLSSSPLPLPSCCAMPALRTHGANLLRVLAPDRAQALVALAGAASAPLPAAGELEGAQEITLGKIARVALRQVHHGVKMVFPWLDTHTTARLDNDTSREISARADAKFRQLVAVMPFQDACNCVRFARFGASELHAELGLALGADKERRTQIHRAVCSVYRQLESKTKASPAGDLIAVRYRSTGRGRGRGRDRGHAQANQRQATCESSISCCLSFTLQKCGVETLYALQQIATVLEVPVASFGYAGTKDAYAVTRQSVTVKMDGEDEKACLQRLQDLVGNEALMSRGLRVEDPALRRTGGMLQLGQHAGNHFRIVLRGALEAQPQAQAAAKIALTRQDRWIMVDAAARSLDKTGFINYFGEQRFQAVSIAGIETVRRTRSPSLPSSVCLGRCCMCQFCTEIFASFMPGNDE